MNLDIQTSSKLFPNTDPDPTVLQIWIQIGPKNLDPIRNPRLQGVFFGGLGHSYNKLQKKYERWLNRVFFVNVKMY